MSHRLAKSENMTYLWWVAMGRQPRRHGPRGEGRIPAQPTV